VLPWFGNGIMVWETAALPVRRSKAKRIPVQRSAAFWRRLGDDNFISNLMVMIDWLCTLLLTMPKTLIGVPKFHTMIEIKRNRDFGEP
jgi:hypothetical protein